MGGGWPQKMGVGPGSLQLEPYGLPLAWRAGS